MRIHGLEPRQGETAFAFLVLRFQTPANRAALVAAIRQFAPIIPDVDSFLDELPVDETSEPFRLLGIPWVPPEAGSGVDMQRRLVEASKGIEEAWFFQTGTSLPSVGEEEDDEEDDAFSEGSTRVDGEAYVEQSNDVIDLTDDEGTHPIRLPEADDDDEDDGDATWSHGPPPVVTSVRFPVDGYPKIIDELDWEDVGIAFKLAGPPVPGEGTVLVGFHALWLAPYGGRHRNAAVTIDRTHHSAHLWVDRFAVPISHEELVGHLLWIVTCLDAVVPVVHARFAGASMQQKYGGMMGDVREPFVLGGNPLLAVYADGGDDAIDGWLETGQEVWSIDEIAQMLRELAIEVMTDDSVEIKQTLRTPTSPGDEDVEEIDEDAVEDEEVVVDRRREVTRYAAEVLVARAKAGLLDPRAIAALRPLLEKAGVLDDGTN